MNLRLFFLSFCSAFACSLFAQNAPPSLVWEKKYGNGGQYAMDIVALANGNMIAVGKSSGDTMPGHHGNAATPDGWIIMLDTAGNLVWQRSIGGSGKDYLTMILPSGDGNFICFGLSTSTDGDLTGNTASGAWVLKITGTGNIIWSRTYAGIYYEYFNATSASSLGTVLHDGSIALSIVPDWGVALSILKLNANGDVAWRSAPNNLTGKFVIETNDHKLLTSNGLMFDETTGDTSRFTGFPASAFNEDFPPLKVDAIKKLDGKIWVAVSSPVSNSWGYFDDASRSFVMQHWSSPNTITGPEYLLDGNGLDVMAGNNIVLAGYAKMYNITWGYDGRLPVLYAAGRILPYNNFVHAFAGQYASVKVFPGGDAFVVAGVSGDNKFLVSKYIMLNAIRGAVFLDDNGNNMLDNGEAMLDNFSIQSSRAGVEVMNKPLGGYFNNNVDTGTYVTSVVLDEYPWFQSNPLSKTSTFTSYKNTDSVNFAIRATGAVRNFSVSLTALTPARPFFPITYKIDYVNKGTDTSLNGRVYFLKDPRLSIVQTIPAYDGINGDSTWWNISSLKVLSGGSILILMISTEADPIMLGDHLGSSAFLETTGDINTADNSSFVKQVVTGSFDPNDKAEAHGNTISKLEMQNGNYLTYTIRFQNTGTDTAFNIFVRDTLDQKLDWASIETVTASHAYQLKIKNDKFLEWKFPNILLADSFVNEPASHGYIVYRIKPKNNLQLNDTIYNSASIYFDFNTPVKTNTQWNEIVKTTAIWKGSVSTAWENPANWNIDAVPDAETLVIIPEGVPNYPVVNSNVSCFSIKADPTATITVTAGFNIDITGK